MKRLYYLSPTIDSAEQVSNDLHEKGITDWHFHIVSKDEDIVARVNCFVCSTSSPDKRIDGELFNMMVRYEDVDPEKLDALSKFVAKVR